MAKAMQITKPGTLNLIDVDSHRFFNPPVGWVAVEVKASGICGTDIHIFKGEYMGDYPVVPGHEFSGKIIAVGPKVSRWKVNDRVAAEPNLSCGICDACLHNRQHFCEKWEAIGVTLSGGMAAYVLAPQEALFDIGTLSYEEGAFMEPLSCVVHGVDRLQPKIGDTVLLAGAGPIGLLLLRVLQSYGAASVDVVEKHDQRRKAAEKSGARAVYSGFETIKIESYDAVVDATGSPQVLELITKFVRSSGKVLFFGVPPKDSEIKISPFQLFSRELTIMSSFTSLRNSEQALNLMKSGMVNVKDLISHTLILEKLEEGFSLITEGRESVLKVMIKPAG